MTLTDKVIKAMEAITNIGESVMHREARIRDLERDSRALESQLIISEKERIIQQRRDSLQSPTPMLTQVSSMQNFNMPHLVKNNSISIFNKENYS